MISITLVPDSVPSCSCGQASESIHDTQWRTLKDAMILDIPVELLVQTRRIKCSKCGIKTESISWVKPYSRLSQSKPCMPKLYHTLLPICTKGIDRLNLVMSISLKSSNLRVNKQ
ncbi:transposase family protein [Vibrio sp. PNB23_22_6]